MIGPTGDAFDHIGSHRTRELSPGSTALDSAYRGFVAISPVAGLTYRHQIY